MSEVPKLGCVNHDCDKCQALAQPDDEPAMDITRLDYLLRWYAFSSGAHSELRNLGFSEDTMKTLQDLKDARAQSVKAQPADEPAAWMYEWNGKKHLTFTDQRWIETAHPHFNKSIPLYARPQPTREWVGLTDEEIKHEWEVWRASLPRYVGFAKGLEAKLKEKNT